MEYCRNTRVFSEELGKLVGYKAKIHIDSDAEPRFFKARSVPYSMKIKIEES